MVRVRRVMPSVVKGKGEIRPDDQVVDLDVRNALYPGHFQTAEEWDEQFILETLIQRVVDARAAGMSVEEIQRGSPVE